MRVKTNPTTPEGGTDPQVCDRIRSELERRGLSAEVANLFARRLTSLSRGVSSEAYEAALDAVVVAYGNGAPDPVTSARQMNELQRLVSGFVGELQKLEEALRTLDAYVTRMRTQTGSSGLLH